MISILKHYAVGGIIALAVISMLTLVSEGFTADNVIMVLVFAKNVSIILFFIYFFVYVAWLIYDSFKKNDAPKE